MFSKLRTWFKNRRERQAASEGIDPQSFRQLAAELKELADAAGRLWPDEASFQERIRRIKSEMDQLDELTSRPEFRRLTRDRRQRLRESIIQSRDQLLQAVQAAPAPTDWKQ